MQLKGCSYGGLCEENEGRRRMTTQRTRGYSGKGVFLFVRAITVQVSSLDLGEVNDRA